MPLFMVLFIMQRHEVGISFGFETIMTVKEIFELRKEGRIEEAYDAIRPMYAAHKGKYTSICMFWTASDIFKLRLEQKRYDEARQIFQALKRMLPYVEDKEGKAAASIQNAARRLNRVTANQTTDAKKNPSDSITSIPSSLKEQSNSVDSCDSCSKKQADSITSITSSSKEEKDSSVIEEDLAGHLVVGLDEGMNRLVEGIINARQRVLDYIRAHEGCSVPKITIALTIPAKSVERHVAALVADELVEHRGSKKTGGYYAINAKNKES